MPKQPKIPAVRFNLKSKQPDNQETLILAIFRYHDQRLVYSTQEKVIPSKWNLKTQRAKYLVDFPDYPAMNDRLNEIGKTIHEVYRDFDYKPANVEDFKSELDLRLGRAKPPQPEEMPSDRTFIQFVDEYLEERQNAPTYQRGTWKVLNTGRNHLARFIKSTGKIDIPFNEIDWHFRKSFENWLYGKQKHSINYAAKMMEVFRQFLHEAKRRQLMDQDLHTDPKWPIKKTETKKIRYTFEELELLYDLDLSGNTVLEKARDLFLIGAYSGLRFSDFNRLKPEHMIEHNGVEMIVLRMQKTGHEVVIPVSPILKALLSKYNYNPPKYHNQVFNRYIKLVCKIAGFDEAQLVPRTAGGKRTEVQVPKWELTSSHVARRSFASNYYELGIPAINLMRITGHRTESQFMKYICIGARENAKNLYKHISGLMKHNHLKAI